MEKLMDFVMDIEKLNLANLMGKVMDKIMEFQIFCQSVQKYNQLDKLEDAKAA